MRKLRVLIGCEESGTVRRAFRSLGHDAISCDLLPARDGSLYHSQTDVLKLIMRSPYWDLAIFHPPCKFVALCQAWRRKPSKADAKLYGLDPNDTTWRLEQRRLAVAFATDLWTSDVKHIALEQPKSMLSTLMAPKSQTIHPWQFGHPEQKETWLWLKNLPKLVPTNDVYEQMMRLPKKDRERVFYSSPGDNRSRDRSATYEGIAEAMAEQWSNYILNHA